MKIFLNERILIGGGEWTPANPDEISVNIRNLIESLNCFNFHTEPTIYYTGEGITRLFENLTELSSFSDYALTNPIQQLRNILNEINSENWDLQKNQRTDYVYYFQSCGGATTYNVNTTSIAEATEYKYENKEVGILNLTSSQFNETNPIHISRSNINLPPDIQTFAIRVFTLKQEAVSYITEYRKERNYNWNPKHGENGKGMISNKDEDVSPLECSKEIAAELLNVAVSCKGTDELYAYDIDREKFMVFKSDNTPNNSYHSYHPIKQNEVPPEVREFLLPT